VGTQLGYATAVALPFPPPAPDFLPDKHTWQLDNHRAICKLFLVQSQSPRANSSNKLWPSYFCHTNLKQQSKIPFFSVVLLDVKTCLFS